MPKPKMILFGGSTDHVLTRLAEAFEVLYPTPDQRADVLAQHGAEIEYAMLLGHVDLNGAVFDQMPNLKILSNFGVGYDAIDTQAAVDRGIMVTHTPDVLNDEVANTTILLMLAVAREFNRDEAYVRSGRWETGGAAPLTRSVKGKTVGILGFGRIGQAIAEKLTVFGTETIYHARSDKGLGYRYCPDLVGMARESDYLIVITPGGPETKHLVNTEVIEALGPQGTLINVARGSVVDEAALIAALQDGRLGAAGLDVFENEPHVPEALRALSNVVLLPHVGSATVETRQAMGDLAVDNLLRFLAGEPVISPVPECQQM